jgi:5-methyltetrahydropteroyltriglutamate--homocysteine methyltransferase
VLIQKMFIEDEGGQHLVMPVVDGPIELRDRDAVKLDIANLKAALGDVNPDDAFIPAVTPGQMLFNFPNRYYPSREAYLEAAGNALRVEYQAIIDAGFNLQLDAPDLAMHHHSFSDGKGPIALKNYIPAAIEALNHATRGLPPDKMRLHLYWGNYAGPHHHDIELRDIIEPVLKARASFIYFEAANPRHEHEWEVWQDIKLPDGKAMIPGVIDTVTNTVEHPRLVAQRLERFASIVGKENVIGGTDCGFGTFVGFHLRSKNRLVEARGAGARRSPGVGSFVVAAKGFRSKKQTTLCQSKQRGSARSNWHGRPPPRAQRRR